MVEPEPEVNPAASESSSSESESGAVGSAETDAGTLSGRFPNQKGDCRSLAFTPVWGRWLTGGFLRQTGTSLVAFVSKELITELLLRPCLDLRLLSIRWTQSLPSASFDGRDGWSTGFYQAALATSSGPVRKG